MPRTILGLVLLVFLAAACAEQGETTSGPTGPSSPTVTSVTITGSLTIGNIGQTSQMTATAHFAKGTTENVTTQAAWSSSDAAVATVSPAGIVTSVAVGTVTITATYQSVSGSTRVSITRPSSYTLSGLITESVPHTTTALAGVRVEFLDGVNQGKSAVTDNSGRYQIAEVLAGNFNVRASLTGYTDGTKQVGISANTTLDFALVPALRPISETFSRQISSGDLACQGYLGYPCQVFDIPLHNTGPLDATLTWTSTADAYLVLQLYSVDSGQVIAELGGTDLPRQFLRQDMSTPGNYQLRVLALRLSKPAITFTLLTNHTN